MPRKLQFPKLTNSKLCYSKFSAKKRISIRDRLLVKEVQELESNMPKSCAIQFNDPNVLSEFVLTITPDEG